MKSKIVSTYGVLVALAFIFSYIEAMFPIPMPVPGMKLGLANVVVVVSLYTMGYKEAFIISLVRILLVGFTFGNMNMLLYSLVGGGLSFFAMAAMKKLNVLSSVGVSVVGSIFHNIGQIVVAMVLLESSIFLYYIPFLLVSAVVCGVLIGILGRILSERMTKVLKM